MSKQQIDKELRAIYKKLRKVKPAFENNDYKKVLETGAIIARDEIRKEAPIGKRPYHMVKDGGGKTIRVKAGNLRKSIQVFTFKKSAAVFAGPIVAKASKAIKVTQKLNKRFRAFYWRFVYYGAYNNAPDHFIDRAQKGAKGKVKTKLIAETKKYLPKSLSKIFK